MEFIYNNVVLITYLFTRVDAVKDALSGATALACVVCIVSIVARSFIALNASDSSYLPSIRRITTVSLITWLAMWFINVAVPPRNDLALIAGVAIGTSVGKQVIESPVAKKSIALLEAKIDAALEETQSQLVKKVDEAKDKATSKK